jgi:hypothetical protein
MGLPWFLSQRDKQEAEDVVRILACHWEWLWTREERRCEGEWRGFVCCAHHTSIRVTEDILLGLKAVWSENDIKMNRIECRLNAWLLCNIFSAVIWRQINYVIMEFWRARIGFGRNLSCPVSIFASSRSNLDATKRRFRHPESVACLIKLDTWFRSHITVFRKRAVVVLLVHPSRIYCLWLLTLSVQGWPHCDSCTSGSHKLPVNSNMQAVHRHTRVTVNDGCKRFLNQEDSKVTESNLL